VDTSLPAETLLTWAWQRWELEVQHREIKSGFGLAKNSAELSLRSGFRPVERLVYALLLLAAYRTWAYSMAFQSRPLVQGFQTLSFNALWRAFRAALWNTPDFQAVWTAPATTG